MKNSNTPTRCHLSAGMASLAAFSAPAQAASPATTSGKTSELVASTLHKIVFQLNKVDDADQDAIFNSISAVLKKTSALRWWCGRRRRYGVAGKGLRLRRLVICKADS
jgi:hypothetical protein